MNARSAFLTAICLCAAFEAHAQDGSSCTQAIPLSSMQTYNVDTSTASNWMTTFGPLVSPSNDLAYTFTLNAGTNGFIRPTASSYAFAMYVIADCNPAGAQSAPVLATATINTAMTLTEATLTAGHQYYLAVTGTAAGGPGANGTLTFDVFATPVTLQSFEID